MKGMFLSHTFLHQMFINRLKTQQEELKWKNRKTKIKTRNNLKNKPNKQARECFAHPMPGRQRYLLIGQHF